MVCRPNLKTSIANNEIFVSVGPLRRPSSWMKMGFISVKSCTKRVFVIVVANLDSLTFLFTTTDGDLGQADSCIFSLFFSRYLCEFLLVYFPESLEIDHDVHMDICWQRLEGDNMCAQPLQGRRTTYTECCCLYGIAWSGQCAFCPRRDSGEKKDAHKTQCLIIPGFI